MTHKMKSVLIIGIQGALAKITSELLIKRHPEIKIHGVDSRPIEQNLHQDKISTQQIRYTRTNFEKYFVSTSSILFCTLVDWGILR